MTAGCCLLISIQPPSQNPPINNKMSSMRTKKKTMRSLRIAIRKRNVEQVRDILQMRPRLRCSEGAQMLWSVIMDHPEIGEMLVRSGADLDERNQTDNTNLLLYVASKSNHDEYQRLALLMLERGANVNFRTNNGNTALHLAVRNESIELVEALVERGLSVDIANADRETAICMAAKSTRAKEMLGFMVEQRPIDKKKRNKRVLDTIEFLICAEKDETKAIGELLKFGVDVNERSDCGLTPMSLAVARGKSNLLEMLMEYGSDMSQLMKESNLPIIRASYMEQSLLLNLLHDQGASVNVCDEYGRNRLHVVCACSKFMPLRNVQLLLHLGADVNCFDSWGNTPFSLMDVNASNDSRQLYIKHLALLFWKGAMVSDNDMLIVRNDRKANRFYEDCLDELQRMKETTVMDNEEFSMFDVFAKSLQRLTSLMKCDGFVKSYHEKKRLFPLYFRDLEVTFEIALDRRDLLRLTEDIVDGVTCGVLPKRVVERIAYYVCLDKLCKLQREFYFELHAKSNQREMFDNNVMITD